MDRMEMIRTFLEPLMEEKFQNSLKEIETYSMSHASSIAEKMILDVRESFEQTAKLQSIGQKGAVKYFVISHLYSSICTESYLLKLDLFDHNFYADLHPVDAYLDMSWIYGNVKQDMVYFEEQLANHIPRIKRYETEQVRYQYIRNYHGIALEFLKQNMGALLSLPDFLALERDPDVKVLFGGYMDRAVLIEYEENRL